MRDRFLHAAFGLLVGGTVAGSLPFLTRTAPADVYPGNECVTDVNLGGCHSVGLCGTYSYYCDDVRYNGVCFPDAAICVELAPINCGVKYSCATTMPVVPEENRSANFPCTTW